MSNQSDDGLTLSEAERRIDDQLGDSYDRPLREIVTESPVELLIYFLGTVFFLYHIWYAFSLPIVRGRHAVVHLGLVLMFWGAVKMAGTDRSALPGKLWTAGYAIYMVLTTIPIYYIFDQYRSLQISAGSYGQLDVLAGALIIVLLLIALWSVSRLISGVVFLGLVYSYFGSYMPGILHHRGLSLRRIVTMNTIELQGVFGTLLQVVATWVVMFVLLSALIEKYGGMSTFVKGITRLTNRHRIQVGQVAVLSSMVFGSINGATTANVATTGSFTIPLMKQNGYPARLAAALESVASSGGQVLPPVMGTSAFIMAELIEPSYVDIIASAIVPAILFYFTIFVSIELYTRNFDTVSEKLSSKDNPRSLIQRGKSVLRNAEYVGMLVMLMYWLVYVRSDPMLAGFYSIVTLAGLRLLKKIYLGLVTEQSVTTSLQRYARENLEGFRRSAEAMLSITIMVAALGIIVRAFIVTGFAQSLSSQLISMAGGNVVLMVILAALASIVFGMGMPTVAAYLLVALFVAPPLSQAVDVSQLAVHMFVFYFAIVSNITPPIAVAVVVAQGIAESDFLETIVDALKMGFPMFLLPFLFIFNDHLLSLSLMTVPVTIILAVGFVALSVAFIGYRGISMMVRGAFFLLGGAIVFAPWLSIQLLLVVFVLAGLVFLHPTAAMRVKQRIQLR